MKKLVYLFPAVAALALTACGDDVTGEDTDGDDSSTSGDPTTDPTTTPTTGPGTTTEQETDSDPTIDPDTGGSESSSDDGGPLCDETDECVTADDCEVGEVCVGCFCNDDPKAGACPGGWGDGEYADCVTEGNGVCTSESGLTPGCVVDDPADSTAGACFFSGCEEACDCPAPPDAAFEDQVTCENIIGDDANDCYIDCSSGGCPDGMFCFLDTICLHGEAPEPLPDIPPYGDCLNEDGMCEDGGQCISDGASFGACAPLDCMDATDCAEGPGTGTAEPSCVELPGKDAGSICTLECTDGETCPDGMFCVSLSLSGTGIGSHCMWPPEVVGYADCLNDGEGVCVDGEACVVNEAADPTTGVCASGSCADASDCPVAPDGGDAVPVCADIDGMAGDECALDCSGGETCPDGMVCTGDGYCAWEEVPVVGFDDCANNPDDICLEGEICVTDAMADPDTAVCAQSGCVDPMSDCPALPAGGDAPAICSNIDGMAGDECALDCSGGETCPDGMACTADGYCAWESAGFVLFEDFSSGGFADGWLLFDVDGQTPAGQVSFVTDAWVVTDLIDKGDPAAYSTSWYAPAGTADDWMVSPPVPLSATSVLSWDGLAPDAMFADGYEVYVVDSTDMDLMDFIMSGDPVTFLAAHMPVFTIEDETQTYTTRTLSAAGGEPLNGLVGSTVRVLWRNNSIDENLLLIDNISVTE